MTSLTPPTEQSPEAVGFAAMQLSEPVLRALDEIGYTEPTPVQAATYPIAISGRDVIVQARTGTGKTAAFGIPLVDRLVSDERHVQALVLAPTRELAVQSQREIARLAQHKGLHTVAIYGGAPMGRQIDELQSGAQIVSGTPGRVLDHLRRGTLDPSRLRVLVLDEMDEMLSMGFAKELNAILEMLPPRGRRQTMCFSATVDGEVRRHAERHMSEPEMLSLSSDAVSAEQITHQVYMVTGRDRTGDLIRVLEVDDPESAIIFCNMRSETERVATALKQAGFDADWLNGDLPQRDRERIMEDTRKGRLRYLVATDVAARGIDISHLTHVINYTFPESAAVYVHRTGRTGRAGRTGCAISLVSPDELGRLYYLRLEYKISPVERSLPTTGELKTRQELDRVELLANAFSDRPSSTDLALARRLLTHPEVEPILAGLLHTFFGTRTDVDEESAAARRTRKPAPMDAQTETAETPRERRPSREREPRGRGRQREPRGRDKGASEGREPARAERGEGRRSSERPRPERERRRSEASGQSTPPRARARRSQPADGERRTAEAEAEQPVAERERGDETANQVSEVSEQAQSSYTAPETQYDSEAPGQEQDASGEPSPRHEGMLYLALGRRDGVRVGEVARLLRERCELSRAEIGRIRVRDRYTFVDVPKERLKGIITTLEGQTLHDRPLAPEQAKPAK